MPKTIKLFKFSFLALLLLFATTVIATGIYCYYYQDQIIQQLLRQAKKKCKNPIYIKSIQFTALSSFPHIGLLLREVVVKDLTEDTEDLMTAREVYCSFDIWKLFRGQYVMSHLSLAQGKVCWGQDVAHQLAWRRSKQSEQKNSSSMSLDKIDLKDIKLIYKGEQDCYAISTSQMQARLSWLDNELEVVLKGRSTIHGIQLDKVVFAQNLPLSIQATLRYNQLKKSWILNPMQLSHGSLRLTVQGNWGLERQTLAALQIQGEKVTPQLLAHCLPQSYCQYFKPEDLHGQLSLSCSVNRSKSRIWSLRGDFKLDKGEFAVRQVTKPIMLDKLLGAFYMPNLQDLSTASLKINKISSTLASSRFSGHCILNNFIDPHLHGVAEGVIDLPSLSPLLINGPLKNASGSINMQGELTTKLKQLRSNAYKKDNLQLSGGLQAQDVRLKVGPGQLLCKELTGRVVFQDNVWLIQNLTGKLGPGSLSLSGRVRNLLPYLLSDKEHYYADIKSYMDYLDLDALLGVSPTVDAAPAFNISPQWTMSLSCDIQQLHFRRFQGKNVRGQFRVKNQKLIAKQLQLGVAGGKASLSGFLDTSTDHFNIHTSAKLQGVQLGKFFYMLENFHQIFLLDRHLSGEVFSDLNLSMQTDKHWKVHEETIEANMNVRLHNSSLYHFEPIQQLSRYVDKKSLTNLHFSELRNHIRIKDRTVYIPPMEVHSNITRIQVSGKHTFDGRVDYNFVLPFTGLRQQEGKDIPEEISEDALKGINLFLKLQGEVGNYKLSYDAAALGASLRDKLGKQGTALKKLFQGKYREKVQLKKLSSDDYFEFE